MTIIAACDLSPISYNAARSAARLARKLGDSLLLVMVLEPPSVLYPQLSLVAGIDDVTKSLRTSTEAALQNLRESLLGEGVKVETRLLIGSPKKELASWATEAGARLIVMGTHGRGAAARLLLGSVAQETVLSAECPVLVLREDAAPFEDWVAGKRPLRIVAGIDRSGASDAALSLIGILRQAGPCDVTLLHEYWPPMEYTRLGLRGQRDLAKTDPDVVTVLRRELDPMLAKLPGDGKVDLRIEAAWGSVGEALSHEATASKADLLIVGTKQPHGWQRVKMGSAAIATIHSSRVPVLCVPGRTGAQASDKPPSIPTLRSVLVTTDFSDLANAAIPHAYALLRGTGGTVELCHVHERGLAVPAYHYDDPDRALSPQAMAQIEERLRALIPSDAASLGIETKVTVVDGGKPAEQIRHAAERLGASAICLASHGRSGPGRALFGSVAEAVIREADRPVFVVRA